MLIGSSSLSQNECQVNYGSGNASLPESSLSLPSAPHQSLPTSQVHPSNQPSEDCKATLSTRVTDETEPLFVPEGW